MVAYVYKRVVVKGDFGAVAEHMNEVEAKEGWKIAATDNNYPEGCTTLLLFRAETNEEAKSKKKTKGCRICHGSGGKRNSPCTNCEGTGFVLVESEICRP